MKPELESMGAGLEETDRVSEESGEGRAGPGWCWSARTLAATLPPRGSTPGGLPGSEDMDRSGPAQPQTLVRRMQERKGCYPHICQCDGPLRSGGGAWGHHVCSAHFCAPSKARPGHRSPHGPCRRPMPTAGGRRRQRPGPAPQLGNLRRNGFPEPQCKQSFCCCPSPRNCRSL